MRILYLYPKLFYEGWPVPSDYLHRLVPVVGSTFPQLAAQAPMHVHHLFYGFAEKATVPQYKTMLSSFDVVAMSVQSPVYALNTEITLKLCKKISQAKIILGGHHATFHDADWISRGADVVIRHEGEAAFAETLDALEGKRSLSDVAGITFYDAKVGEIVQTEERPFIQDLDSLPLPNWDIVDFSKYWLFLRKGGFPAVVETSRGCPHECIYCCVNVMWRHTQRFKSVERCLEEIRLLSGKGVRQIWIADDNFAASYQRDMQLLGQICRLPEQLRLMCFMRADYALRHPDLVELAARAGLRFVIVGFEHLSPRLLEAYKKGLSFTRESSSKETVWDEYRQVYELFRRNGVMVYGTFVKNIFNETLKEKAMWQLAPAFTDASMTNNFYPYKGVAAEKTFAKKGYHLKDMFYHDRLLSAFAVKGREQAKESLLVNVRNLVNRKACQCLFSREQTKRSFYLRLYKTLLKSIASLTPRKAYDFLLYNSPYLSSDEKQARIAKRYLSAFAGSE